MLRTLERALSFSHCVSILRRGHVSIDTGVFTRGMTRWICSIGPERTARILYFSGCIHVPGCAVAFNFRVRGEYA